MTPANELISIIPLNQRIKAKIGDPSPRLHKAFTVSMKAECEDLVDGTVMYDFRPPFDSAAIQICVNHVNFIENAT